MIAGGVRRCTTKFMGIRWSRLEAWEAVRGNPSRMNEADGLDDAVGARLSDVEVGPEDSESQPLEASSEEINSSIIASGTRLPD